MEKSIKAPPLRGGREGLHLRGGWEGLLLVAFGIILITAAFAVPPMGVIDPTVLTAFGEVLTFSGSVIGIDYHYRSLSPNGLSPKSLS